MPYLETIPELVEDIADMTGAFGSSPYHGTTITDHPEDYKCRNCFVIGMEARIREAIKNEEILERRDKAMGSKYIKEIKINLPCTISIDQVLDALFGEYGGLKPVDLIDFIVENKDWFLAGASEEDIKKLKGIISK